MEALTARHMLYPDLTLQFDENDRSTPVSLHLEGSGFEVVKYIEVSEVEEMIEWLTEALKKATKP